MSKAAELAALIANVNKGSSLANKNFIINGNMSVAQRGTSETGMGASAGYFTVDRWKMDFNVTAGRLTMSQASDGPSGFANSIKLDCTTADTSIAAGEYIMLEQRIEGQNLQSICKGTADAKPLTVSFWCKANAAFTFALELTDNDNTRQISKLFTTTTGWTRHTLTFPADTTGTLDDDNARSILATFWLHSGSNYAGGTLNSSAWASQTHANRAAGIDSFFSSTDNEFYITGVQMEIGEKATEFEHESYEATLEKCQRYCEVHTLNSYTHMGFSYTTAQFIIPYTWKVEKRAAPTFTFPTVGTSSGNLGVTTADGQFASTHGSVLRATTQVHQGYVYNDSGDGYAGLTDDHIVLLYGYNAVSLTIDAEL